MSQRKYAAHRGCNPSYISRLITKGVLHRHEGGKLDSDECDRVLDAAHDIRPGDGVSLIEAQTRKTQAEAQLKELTLAIKQRECVGIADVIAIVEREYGNVRNSLLSLPSKIAARFPVSQRGVVFETSKRCVYQALTNLSAPAKVAEAKK